MSRDKTTTGDLTLLGNKGTKYDDKYILAQKGKKNYFLLIVK